MYENADVERATLRVALDQAERAQWPTPRAPAPACYPDFGGCPGAFPEPFPDRLTVACLGSRLPAWLGPVRDNDAGPNAVTISTTSRCVALRAT